MNDTAIVFKNVSKEYYLEKPRTLTRWFNTLFSSFNKFTVIKDMSLVINKGNFILVTGSNGSGKTTFLKLIAGITLPNKGSIKTYGKIVPLIELGAGFNYELTGRENIIINATILGIGKKKIKRITPQIIEFSGLKNFIDIPLKRFSLGMISRLAFSIVSYSDPDILLLDEVFAMGDEEFRRKIISKLNQLRLDKITVIIVSHYPERLREIIEIDKEISLKNNNLQKKLDL
ncbi:MAG: ATP-binding cassette domain-containing protein [bacterium]|nr:ATP-binding cassette domain-containing protein [bacterium]